MNRSGPGGSRCGPSMADLSCTWQRMEGISNAEMLPDVRPIEPRMPCRRMHGLQASSCSPCFGCVRQRTQRSELSSGPLHIEVAELVANMET